MKRVSNLIIFLSMAAVIVVCSICFKTIGFTQSSNNEGTNTSLSEQIKGIELITDKNFRKQLIYILEESEKAIRIKQQSQSAYPDGAGFVRYLEVIGFNILNKDKYQVDLIGLFVSEGSEYEQRLRYFFVNKDNEWKLDGADPTFE